jgi:hypothetical protein
MSNITLPSLVRVTFPEDESAYLLVGLLCASWSMPALEHLRCSDDIHDALIPELLPVPLKSLRYTEHRGWTTELIKLRHLTEAESVVGVEELTLRFKKPLVHRDDVVYSTLHMKNLRSFTVDFTTTTPNKVAEMFFEFLDLPALEVFEFKQNRWELFGRIISSGEGLLQPYLHCLNWLLVDYRTIRTRFPKLKEVRITIDGVEDEELCDNLRDRLDEKFRIEWFGGDLGITGEEECVEVFASAPQVHFWIHPRRSLVQSG